MCARDDEDRPGPSGFRTYTATSAMSRFWEALSRACGAGAGGSPMNISPRPHSSSSPTPDDPGLGMGLGADRPPSLNRNTRWSQSPRFWLGPTGRGRGDAAVLASFSIGTVTACGARGQ